MRRLATLLAAAALVGALWVPSPAVATESPLPGLTPELQQALCQTPLRAPDRAMDKAVPQAAQGVQSPQLCSSE